MQPLNYKNVKSIIKRCNINPTKDKGQNFLVDEKISKNIVDLAKINANSRVLEIGPGLGSLTYHLLSISNNLTLVDIDERIINYLKSELNNDINIIHSDALKYDVSNYDIIVSNIPYNITTNLITHCLINAKSCNQFVFMVQKENFNHFSDIKGSEYGPLSVLIHLLGNINKAFDVPPSAFVPSPKCTSTIFTIDIDENIDRELAVSTYHLATKLFKARRKTIYNNLSVVTSKDNATKLLNKLGIPLNYRPEQISPNQFKALNELIISEIK